MNDKNKRIACISLGSNILPEKNLPAALKLLLEYGIECIAASNVWQSVPVGTGGPDYLNAAVLIRTYLEPQDLKHQVLRNIEDELGRVRTEDKFAPRPIDIDILTYDGETFDAELWELPHLAVPFSELMPQHEHQLSHERIADISERMLAKGGINMRSDIVLDF